MNHSCPVLIRADVEEWRGVAPLDEELHAAGAGRRHEVAHPSIQQPRVGLSLRVVVVPQDLEKVHASVCGSGNLRVHGRLRVVRTEQRHALGVEGPPVHRGVPRLEPLVARAGPPPSEVVDAYERPRRRRRIQARALLQIQCGRRRFGRSRHCGAAMQQQQQQQRRQQRPWQQRPWQQRGAGGAQQLPHHRRSRTSLPREDVPATQVNPALFEQHDEHAAG